MNNLFSNSTSNISNIQFSVEITADGSPTLRLPNSGESMHHFGGAAAETKYIYKSVIEKCHGLDSDLKTCVVGLGLGYIEISWADCILQQEIVNKRPSFVSFETVQSLKDNFSKWLLEDTHSIYDDICKFMAPSTEINRIKKIISENLKASPFKNDLRRCLNEDNDLAKKFNVVCFDAFSRKTNEELWSPEFLDGFLKNFCAENCVFTTYACTAVLKKALKDNGFDVIIRPGFRGKRDSTLAVRGVFKSVDSFRIF